MRSAAFALETFIRSRFILSHLSELLSVKNDFRGFNGPTTSSTASSGVRAIGIETESLPTCLKAFRTLLWPNSSLAHEGFELKDGLLFCQ